MYRRDPRTSNILQQLDQGDYISNIRRDAQWSPMANRIVSPISSPSPSPISSPMATSPMMNPSRSYGEGLKSSSSYSALFIVFFSLICIGMLVGGGLVLSTKVDPSEPEAKYKERTNNIVGGCLFGVGGLGLLWLFYRLNKARYPNQ